MEPRGEEEPHAPGASAASSDGPSADASAAWIAWLPALLLSFAYVAVLFWLAAHRLPHPLELEWMEGGSLQHLVRLIAGEPLYPAPTIEFVPFPYPPFYYWLAAWLTPILGVGFASLRFVSFASTLGVLALIYAFIRHEGGDRKLACVSAGIFAATYRASGAYMDIGRIDSLFVVLVLASAYALRARKDVAGLAVAGFLAFLATWTKQTGLVALGPLLLWCTLRDHRAHGFALARWRCAPVFGACFLLPLALATGLVSRDGSEHFLSYILGAQSGHVVRYERILHFFASDLLWIIPIPTLTIVIIALSRRREWRSDAALFYAALGLGVVIACIVPRIKVGGALNNLIPIHAVIVLIGGVALAHWLEASQRARWAVPALVTAQLALCFYDPRIALPAPSDSEKGSRLVQRLERVEGEVLIPAQGYLAGLAGKRVFAHQMPVDDVSRSGLAEAEALRESFEKAIDAQRFDLIIDSTSRFLRSYPNDRVLLENYRLSGPVFNDEQGLVPRSGWPIGPGEVWVPKRR